MPLPPMKAYYYKPMTPERYRDALGTTTQCQVVVLAQSWTAAVDALIRAGIHVTMYTFRNFGSEGIIRPVFEEHPPLTVLAWPLNQWMIDQRPPVVIEPIR